MNRIKELRIERGEVLSDIAKILDVSIPLIKYYENGERNPSIQKAQQLAEYFNVSVDYLLGNSDERNPASKTTWIPIIGEVKAGYDFLAQENRCGSVEVENDLIKDHGTYFAVRVVGDSMLPVFEQDDILVIRKQEDFENGKYIVALINGTEITIKKGKKTENGIMLLPSNSNYDPLVFSNKQIEEKDVVIMGIVKRAMRNFF